MREASDHSDPTIPPQREEFQFFRFRGGGDYNRTNTIRQKVKPWLPKGFDIENPDGLLFMDTYTVAAQAQVVTPLSGRALPPVRQYYHSRSRLPMRTGDWEEDSDDESDDEWIDDLGRAVRFHKQ